MVRQCYVYDNRIPSRLRAEWERLARELMHPDIELTPEEAAPLLSLWKQLRAIGHVFDPMLSALLGILDAQIRAGEDDTDRDDEDERWRVEENATETFPVDQSWRLTPAREVA